MRSPAVRSIPAVILLAVAVVSTASLPLGNALWAKALGVVGEIHIKERHHHGCTPGFWKQDHHLKYWPARNGPNQFFSVAFQTSMGEDLTLMETLKLRGGGDNALMRQAAAALLNAGSQQLEYRYTTTEVLEMFGQAVDSHSFEPVKDLYEAANSDGCPFEPSVVATALNAEVMAYATHTHRTIFDWALAVTADPPELVMEPGSKETIHVGLVPQRFETEHEDEYRAQGVICLTNTGDGITQGLAVDVVVQAIVGDDEPSDLAESTLDVSDKPALDPGEYYCYFYEIPFSPEPSATHRTVVRIWIDNYLDHTDGPYGPEVVTVFDLASPAETIETDAESLLSLELICPQGFACGIGDPGPWLLRASTAIDLDLELTSDSPTCTRHTVGLNASLLEADTGQLRPAENGIIVQAIGCPVVEAGPQTPTPTPTLPVSEETPEATSTPLETGEPTEEPTPTPSP